MRRIATGSQSAFEEFARRYEPMLRALCHRHMEDPHDAADLQQEVLVRVWSKAGEFSGRSALTTWLYRIVANLAVDEHRRRRQRPAPIGPLPQVRAGDREDTEPAAAKAVELRWALARLAPHYRAVAVLSGCCDLPDHEVARLCGIAETTVRTRLHRARRALRAVLASGAAA